MCKTETWGKKADPYQNNVTAVPGFKTKPPFSKQQILKTEKRFWKQGTNFENGKMLWKRTKLFQSRNCFEKCMLWSRGSELCALSAPSFSHRKWKPKSTLSCFRCIFPQKMCCYWPFSKIDVCLHSILPQEEEQSSTANSCSALWGSKCAVPDAKTPMSTEQSPSPRNSTRRIEQRTSWGNKCTCWKERGERPSSTNKQATPFKKPV